MVFVVDTTQITKLVKVIYFQNISIFKFAARLHCKQNFRAVFKLVFGSLLGGLSGSLLGSILGGI
jgi:hypothetical protein